MANLKITVGTIGPNGVPLEPIVAGASASVADVSTTDVEAALAAVEGDAAITTADTGDLVPALRAAWDALVVTIDSAQAAEGDVSLSYDEGVVTSGGIVGKVLETIRQAFAQRGIK